MSTDRTEANWNRHWHVWAWVSVLVACGLTFFANLGGAKLWDRDEPRNAGCAREMLERADWVVPVFNAELRTHKPVLLYWVMMAAYRVAGVNEFAARLGSALAGTITVGLSFWAGQRLFGWRAGWFAALALASCLMFTVAARAATPDSLLILCTTGALVSFIGLAWGEVAWPTFPRGYGAAVLIYAWMALAVLAKGPVGVVLPCAVIGMYLLIARRVTLGKPELPGSSGAESTVIRLSPASSWSAYLGSAAQQVASWFAPLHFLSTLRHMRLGVALAMLGLIALPWYVWVGLRTDGAWLRGFLWEHNVNRAMAPMEGHSGPFIYYPVAMLVGFFPWSIFAVPVLAEVWRGRMSLRQRAGVVFLLCWVGVYVGLFSLARTKLPSYITPIYPALALLVGWFLDRWLARTAVVGTRWMVAAFSTLATVGLVVAVGLPWAASRYFPGDEWLGLVGLIPITAGLWGTWAVLRDRRDWAVAGLLPAAVALLALAFGWVAVRVSDHQQYSTLVAAIRGEELLDGGTPDSARGASIPARTRTVSLSPPSNSAQPPTHLMSYRYLEPSWVFYAGQPIETIRPNEGERVVQRLTEHPRVCLIVARRDWDELRTTAAWARDFRIIGRAPYFLRHEELLVVESTPLVARRATP